ncbi:MAG TPA: CDP-alcohol phosphatidyltransferase family protein, partial [Mycobacteriales bacterium]|nr:CDP-alcohol phosphatidyltransferase family protein [Mycobacteriales bacterium]
ADGWALVVLAVGGLTDYLDGRIARSFGMTSRLGQLLDPAADRLYILATLLGLALRGIIPWWLAVAIPGRDVLLAGLLPVLRRHGYGPPPVHFLGKAATFNLLYAFPLLLFSHGTGAAASIARVLGWAFAGWGTALYFWAGFLYVVQVRSLVRPVGLADPLGGPTG